MADVAFACHYEASARVNAPAEAVFAWLDDHRNLAAHMSRSSMMMPGGSMRTVLDEGQGRRVGSHMRMDGRVMGLLLSLDEVIIQREPPASKVWATVGEPRLWVMGGYRMGFQVKPTADGSEVTVFIDYNPPGSPVLKLLSRWMGRPYAVWCVEQMLAAVRDAFGRGN